MLAHPFECHSTIGRRDYRVALIREREGDELKDLWVVVYDENWRTGAAAGRGGQLHRNRVAERRPLY